MNIKRILSVVLVFAMICSPIISYADDIVAAQTPSVTDAAVTSASGEQTTVNENNALKANIVFSDIPADAPYYDSVKKLVENGVINGYPDGTFKPDGGVTRAEMCKMVNLTLRYTSTEGAVGFPDVTPNDWYYSYAIAAQKAGYIQGYEDLTFRASNNITRQEVCAILCRLLKPMDLGLAVTVSDTVDDWAKEYVRLVVQNFLMPLEENNTFRATEVIKRHELASVLSGLVIGPVETITANVRFFVDGTQYGETQTLAVGLCAKVPADPVSSDTTLHFAGWRAVGTEDVVDVESLIVTADVDYEAVFTEKTHSVKFYNRGRLYKNLSVGHKGIVRAPADPKVDGFIFKGWALEEDGAVLDLRRFIIIEDVKLYAVYEKGTEDDEEEEEEEEPVYYNVRFKVNGKTVLTQEVLEGSYPTAPDDPEVEGMKFVGWSLKNGSTDDIISNFRQVIVLGNLDIYAVFVEDEEEPVFFDVTFHVEGQQSFKQSVLEGLSPTQPEDPEEIEGKTFVGWSLRAGNSTDIITNFKDILVYKPLDIYAVFVEKEEEPVYYEVTFHVDGKTSKQEVLEGLSPSQPANPVVEGKKFVGWSLRADNQDDLITSFKDIIVLGNLNIYAIFVVEEEEPVFHDVTFYVEGKVASKQSVLEGSSPTMPGNPSLDGYVFMGWSLKKGSQSDIVTNFKSIVVKAPVNMYAVFVEEEKDPVYYDVNFYVDGKVVSTQSVLEGMSPRKPGNPTYEDMIFVGWSTIKNNQSGLISSFSDIKVNSNMSIYALFKEKPVYTVSFYVDGVVTSTQRVLEGSYPQKPQTPSLDGMDFVGWSTVKNNISGLISSFSSIEVTGDMSIYAIFNEKPVYTVSFYVDGKVASTQRIVEGKSPEKPQTPAKDGFKFIGWSLRRDSKNDIISNFSAISVTSNMSIYAVFEEEEKEEVYYTVSFYVDGKVDSTQRVLEGSSPVKPADPNLDGYDFIGWSTVKNNNSGLISDFSDVTVNKNMSIYALFEEKEVELKYFNVFFRVDGEVYYKQEVLEGSSPTAPDDPEKNGETFTGWSLRENGSIIDDFDDIVVTKHIDIYAVFFSNPNSDELIGMLERGKTQLNGLRMSNSSHKSARTVIVSCIGKVLTDAKAGIKISKSYVTREYSSDVNEVKRIVNGMSQTERSNFVNIVTRNVDKDVQDFLMDYFDIDMSSIT